MYAYRERSRLAKRRESVAAAHTAQPPAAGSTVIAARVCIAS